MNFEALPPIRFLPIFKSAIWGGQRLRPMLGYEPAAEPIGEAWILSDQGENHSVVADGSFAGRTLRSLLEEMPKQILGDSASGDMRFPCLLKFIDASLSLSVQVHPTDEQAGELEPGGPSVGKTEAWVILEAEKKARIYAGLNPGVSRDHLRTALDTGRVEEVLFSCHPEPMDCFFLKAGTVHAIGAEIVLFEVQQTSDITYRLYDWGRVDPKTGKSRELHLEKGLACVDDTLGPCRPIVPTHKAHGRVRLLPFVESDYFNLGCWDTNQSFKTGENGECRVLIGVRGQASLRHQKQDYSIEAGHVWLLSATTGSCEITPSDDCVILECRMPQ